MQEGISLASLGARKHCPNHLHANFFASSVSGTRHDRAGQSEMEKVGSDDWVRMDEVGR